MSGPFERRARACRRALADVGAEAIVLFPSPNCYYVSGFRDEPMERHLLLFITPDWMAFVVPELYAEQVRAESWITDVRTWADGQDAMAIVDATLDDLGIDDGRVLVDDRMWAMFTQDLATVLPDAEFGLASEVFDDLRTRKDETEIDALLRAGAISDAASEAVRSLGADAIGMTERELAREIESEIVEAGGEGLSFEAIVASGENGAQPHYRHGDRTIRAGEPVVLDFGGVVDGYPGDQTRTVVFDGDPPDGFEAVFDAVLDAHHAGIEAVEPGVEAREIDRVARTVIEEAGFGEQFVHRTGHGVGLDVHEAPYIVEGNETPLEPGMVFSVEPGVYIQGEFGVRIEDLVVVTESGHERLNDSPRTWRTL